MSESMPHLKGITGYFDISTIDTVNNKWVNAIDGGNDIAINGTITSDGESVHFGRSTYGVYAADVPQTIYALLKTNSLSSEWIGIIAKQLTSNTAAYEFGIFAAPLSSGFVSFNANGGSYSVSDWSDYHVFVISRQANGALIYVDDYKTAITAGDNSTAYGGNYYINKANRNSWQSNCGDVNIKMMAFGSTSHTPSEIAENIAFLLSGIAPEISEPPCRYRRCRYCLCYRKKSGICSGSYGYFQSIPQRY